MFNNVLPNVKTEVHVAFAFAVIYTLFSVMSLWLIQVNGYTRAVDIFIQYNDMTFVIICLLSVVVGMSLSLNILASPFIYKPSHTGFKFLNIVGAIGALSTFFNLFFLGSIASQHFDTSSFTWSEILVCTVLVISVIGISKVVHMLADNIELTHRIQKLDIQIESFENARPSKKDEEHLQTLYALKETVEANPTSKEHKLALKTVIAFNEQILQK